VVSLIIYTINLLQAFKYFIKAAQNGADEEKAINAAIHVVSTSKDDQLAVQLVSFLSGEHDNIPKVFSYFSIFFESFLRFFFYVYIGNLFCRLF